MRQVRTIRCICIALYISTFTKPVFSVSYVWQAKADKEWLFQLEQLEPQIPSTDNIYHEEECFYPNNATGNGHLIGFY